MSKHPEKFIKETFKEKEIKEQKEHKEKEFKEHKDKPEKEHKEKDIKEHKDKPEKEHKEIIKDYKEVKEFKEIEKIQKDKDKDAETQQPTGDPVEAFSLHKIHGKEHPEKVQKDVDKVQKDKDIETIAHAAAFTQPQAAQAAKVIEKTHKDIEKFIKDKDFKSEKHEKFEKLEWKEFIKEWDVPISKIPVDPGGPVEQRVAVLESVVSQLMHFIPQELRPDLSTGALAEEKRAQGAKPASGKRAKKARAKVASEKK